MKTVFSNSEITHVFCNRIQNEGRTSTNSMFFNNNVLYSYGYHFELAKFIEFNGFTYLFVNTASYSNTTSKHQSNLRSSINEALIKDVFYFDFKQYGGGWGRSIYEFKLNQECLTDTIQALLLKSETAFKKQLRARETSYLANEGNRNLLLVRDLLATFGDILHNLNSLADKLTSLYPLQNEALLKANLIDKTRDKREKEKREKLAGKEKENLEKWFTGDYNYPLYNLPIYLRLQNDTVQTSHGANVPLEHARHIISLLDKGLDIIGKKIGYYTINEVTLDYIKIGCHKMYFNDVNSFIDKHLRA